MSHFGFMITRLALTGPGQVDAELLFRRGLNVITGPSDTGKTFAFQCIDFMLGASTPPKAIREADDYDSVCLDIHDYQTAQNFSLTRSLKGGSFKLTAHDGDEKVLGEKHDAHNDDTLSQFLLKLASLQGKWIRKTAKGEKRSLSFRDIAHLSVVSEEDIIKSRSPILSGQFTAATVEKSAYTLLISGVDDSSVIPVADTKEIKKRFDAKEEVIEGLIAKVRQKIAQKQIDGDVPSLIDQQERLDRSIHESTEWLNERRASAISLEDSRRAAWAKVKKVDSRLDVLSELQSRFSLLHRQYQSDIRRLQAISESGRRLGEMSLDHCPVCGASQDAHNRDHQECQTDPLAIAESCASEVSRVEGLAADLKSTQEDIQREVTELTSAKAQAREELKDASLELQERLNPYISEAINELRARQEQRDHIRTVLSLHEQVRELEDLRDSLRGETSEKTKRPKFAEPDRRYMEEFAKAVQERLTAWRFPDLDRVVFDPENWDIVISGRSRVSHGKGVRAVTHAAFTLSLLRYCLDNDLPHSGIVVIDSPLVVYKEPDVGEEDFPTDLKAAFFRDLSQSYQDAQVIIIENDPPPEDLAFMGVANVVRFTKTNHGRRGFIPAAE